MSCTLRSSLRVEVTWVEVTWRERAERKKLGWMLPGGMVGYGGDQQERVEEKRGGRGFTAKVKWCTLATPPPPCAL